MQKYKVPDKAFLGSSEPTRMVTFDYVDELPSAAAGKVKKLHVNLKTSHVYRVN